MELARCLTGWSVKDHFWLGEFTFNEDLHDLSSKIVLGTRIEPAGQREAELVLEQLATHPATAQLICSKLVRRFISEDPRPELVESAARTFLSSKGSITATLEHVLLNGMTDADAKVKRPVDLIASGLRVLAADTDGGQPLQTYLTQMGQPAFEWPTPDGPPDNSSYWTSNLLPRWRFGTQLALNQIEGTTVEFEALISAADGDSDQVTFDRFTELMLGTPLDRKIRDDLLVALRNGGATDDRTFMELIVAGLATSPGFQWM